MSILVLILGSIALAISALVAIGNWAILIERFIEHRKHGTSRGISFMLLVSLIASSLAWFALRDRLGLWCFLPAILDPGTLVLLTWPVYFLKESLRKK